MTDISNKAFKSGLWYTAANFLVKGIGFMTTPIFTRILTKSDFGSYNNYVSWLGIATIIVTLNLGATLISARYDFQEDFDCYIFSMLTLSSLSAFFWLLMVNLFKEFFTSFLNLDIHYINAMLVYLIFLPAVELFQGRERYYFEYKKTVAAGLFIAIGTALLSVALVVYFPNKLAGRIMGSIIPTVILGAVFLVFFYNKSKRIKIAYWKYAIPVCLPFIPHLLSLTLLNSMDRIMINRWCGSEDTAIYSLAYTCGSMVTMLMTSMNSAFSPWLGDKLNSNQITEIRKFSKTYIFLFSFLAIGIIAIAPEALLVLGGASYADAKYVLAPIAMGCVCQFLYTMFVNVEQFKKKTIGMAFASLTAAFVNFILNYIFIPRVGYLAAAYTTLAGYLCLLFIHMFLVYRLGLSSIYDYKLIFVVVIVMLGITLLFSLLYSHYIIRLTIIFLYLGIFIHLSYKHKDKVIRLIRRNP